MSYFKKLKISDWQQFRSIDIDFHDRLTILTGANASGKTTILNLLARHTNWEAPFLAVPSKSKLKGAFFFLIRLFRPEEPTDNSIIGELTYESGRVASLVVPKSPGASYVVSIGNQDTVPCFFVPSHRSVYRYQQVTQLPVTSLNKEQAFNRVRDSTRGRYFGGSDVPSSFHMKEILIGWNIFGRGNPDMAPDQQLLRNYEGFQDILRKVLPASLGFRRFSIRNMEIVLECETGDFMIDGASGGLSTLIDLAWQIYMFSTRDHPGFTVIIDEVENHLHPTMQRRVLSDFINAFPTVRFVVSTHSPLIVSAVRDSFVYVLRYNSDHTIESQRLDFVTKVRTATQILDEVLGVSSTLPPWAEQELGSIVNRFADGPINEETFDILKSDMAKIGLDQYLPEAIGKLLDNKQS
jgi:predicted ATPase